MGYAIRNDGLGWRSVNCPEECIDGETYSDEQPEWLPPFVQEESES